MDACGRRPVGSFALLRKGTAATGMLCGVYLRVCSRLGAAWEQAPPTPQRRIPLEVVQAAGGEAVGGGVPLQHRQLGIPARCNKHTRESDHAQTLRRFWCQLPPAQVTTAALEPGRSILSTGKGTGTNIVFQYINPH